MVTVRRKWMTGVAQRTISSTAAAARPSKSSIHQARCSGCSLSASSPWEMALRVVSLPATASNTKNEPSSASSNVSPSTVLLTSAEVRSSVGFRRRASPSSWTSWASSDPAVSRAVTMSAPGGHVLGVTGAQDHVGVLEHELVLAVGDAHHLADDPQRQGGGDIGDEVDPLPFDELVHDLGRGAAHVVLDLLEHPGGEAAGHDAAQAGVARIVHVDHRPEELAERLGQVPDVRPLARAERLRALGGLEDVGVAAQGVVAPPLRDAGVLPLLMERDRPLGPQGGERALPFGPGPRPEDRIGQVDLVGPEHRLGPHGRPGDHRGSRTTRGMSRSVAA